MTLLGRRLRAAGAVRRGARALPRSAAAAADDRAAARMIGEAWSLARARDARGEARPLAERAARGRVRPTSRCSCSPPTARADSRRSGRGARGARAGAPLAPHARRRAPADRRHRARRSATSRARSRPTVTRCSSTRISPSCAISSRRLLQAKGLIARGGAGARRRARRGADVRRSDARAGVARSAGSADHHDVARPAGRSAPARSVPLRRADLARRDAARARPAARRRRMRSRACCASIRSTSARCSTRASLSPSSIDIARRSTGGAASSTLEPASEYARRARRESAHGRRSAARSSPPGPGR